MSNLISSDERSGKLSIPLKIGYNFGAFSTSISAYVYNLFFLVFAVDFVGLNPAFAGVISSAAVLWDAITDPIIGHMSDSLKSKRNLSRQAFMLRALIPFTITFVLLYRIIDASQGVKNVYYVIMAVAFWTSYTLFSVPYDALGVELTNNYNERNSIKIISQIAINVALCVVGMFSMRIVESVLATGGSPKAAWGKLSLIFGSIIFISAAISLFSVRKYKIVQPTTKNNKSSKNIFSTMFKILKGKSIKIVAASIFIYSIGFTTSQGLVVFLMKNILGLNGAQVGNYFVLVAVIGLSSVALINYLSNKIGRRITYIILVIVSAIMQAMFIILDIPNFGWMVTFGVLQGIGHNVFWSIGYSIMYDCCDIDAYANKKRREGTVISLILLCQKAGFAIGTSLAGILLHFFKYDATLTTQSAETVYGVKLSMFIIAPVFFVLSALLMTGFKMNKKRYKALQDALSAMDEGSSHSSDGFEELL
ncbi:MFS transporter [Clostridiaceae bacterium M8S5]|nr:MFS transporter [Clostridiaceae bacterium M8S5]